MVVHGYKSQCLAMLSGREFRIFKAILDYMRSVSNMKELGGKASTVVHVASVHKILGSVSKRGEKEEEIKKREIRMGATWRGEEKKEIPGRGANERP